LKLLHTFLKEIRYNIKGILILALCFGLFFLAFMAIYDPTLFEDMEALLASYPEAIKQMVGKYIALTTFGGFINVYLFSLGINMNDIASNIGSYKSESNELAVKFLQSMVQELDKYKDKSGYGVLSKRVSEMISFFEYNVKVLEKIKESSFIKELK